MLSTLKKNAGHVRLFIDAVWKRLRPAQFQAVWLRKYAHSLDWQLGMYSEGSSKDWMQRQGPRFCGKHLDRATTMHTIYRMRSQKADTGER